MKLEPGTLLGNGKYELTHCLGAGSQAEVWEARQLGLAGFSKTVVLKCMDVSTVGADRQALMLREARLAASLHHPNITAIYDVGQDQNQLYIAMESIHGVDLEVVLERRLKYVGEPIPWELATAMAIEVCKALYYAHAQAEQAGTPLHLVHRDLKPGNILLSYSGYVKVIDFGIAKATHPSMRKDSTHAGRVKGTPAYMSPEQIMEKPLDGRSDLFSLGIILYELLSGQRPFQVEDLFSMLVLVVHEEPKPLVELCPDLPGEIIAITEKLLAKAPEKRFQNARAVRRALESVMRSKQIFIEQEEIAEFLKELDEATRQEPQDTNESKPPPPSQPGAFTERKIDPFIPDDVELSPSSGIEFNVVSLDMEMPEHRPAPTTPNFLPPGKEESLLLEDEEAAFQVMGLSLDLDDDPHEPETTRTTIELGNESRDEPDTTNTQAPTFSGEPEAPDKRSTEPLELLQVDQLKLEESPTNPNEGVDPLKFLDSVDGALPDELDSIFAALEIDTPPPATRKPPDTETPATKAPPPRAPQEPEEPEEEEDSGSTELQVAAVSFPDIAPQPQTQDLASLFHEGGEQTLPQSMVVPEHVKKPGVQIHGRPLGSAPTLDFSQAPEEFPTEALAPKAPKKALDADTDDADAFQGPSAQSQDTEARQHEEATSESPAFSNSETAVNPTLPREEDESARTVLQMEASAVSSFLSQTTKTQPTPQKEPRTPEPTLPTYEYQELDDLLGFQSGERTVASPSPLADAFSASPATERMPSISPVDAERLLPPTSIKETQKDTRLPEDLRQSLAKIAQENYNAPPESETLDNAESIAPPHSVTLEEPTPASAPPPNSGPIKLLQRSPRPETSSTFVEPDDYAASMIQELKEKEKRLAEEQSQLEQQKPTRQSQTPPSPDAPRQPHKSNSWIVVILLLGVVALATALIWFVRS